MDVKSSKNVEYLVVDTSAFIENAPLHNIGKKIITCQEVVNEITSKRQLRRLAVLPYDLEVKNVDPEYVKVIVNFSKKTGDYPSLSPTDILVMALTYQLEKEHVGVDHILLEPAKQRSVNVITKQSKTKMDVDVVGFFKPKHIKEVNEDSDVETSDDDKSENDLDSEEVTDKEKALSDNLLSQMDEEKSVESDTNVQSSECKLDELANKFKTLEFDDLKSIECEDFDKVLVSVPKECLSEEIEKECNSKEIEEECNSEDEDTQSASESCDDEEDDDESGWITPANVQAAKKHVSSDLIEERFVKVACMTKDFAMQNVLLQMHLNVAALDGRMIKQLRTFILRCYACFKTTSIMTKMFCPNCGNKTLKRVGVSVDENGNQKIHINARRPLTGRGQKFSMPTVQGGKYSNNPHLVEDQPFPQQHRSKMARTKTNVLDDAYITGYSPFATRDVFSKSAKLNIHSAADVKYWMRKNPNEVRRHKKKK